jgi:hypothetical protein
VLSTISSVENQPGGERGGLLLGAPGALHAATQIEQRASQRTLRFPQLPAGQVERSRSRQTEQWTPRLERVVCTTVRKSWPSSA